MKIWIVDRRHHPRNYSVKYASRPVHNERIPTGLIPLHSDALLQSSNLIKDIQDSITRHFFVGFARQGVFKVDKE